MSKAFKSPLSGVCAGLCALAAGVALGCSGDPVAGVSPGAAPGGDAPSDSPGMETPATPGDSPGMDGPGTGGDTPPVPPNPDVEACVSDGLASNLPRRLNRAELNNLALDVFGVTSAPFSSLTNDQNSKVAGTSLTVTGAFVELYQTAALEVAAEYIAAENPAASCGGAPSGDCAATLLKPLAERMMRRPLTSELETKLGTITQTALDGGLTFDEGIQDSILALFLFPETLYMDTRVTATPGTFQLDSYSIAERLALALWNSVPDEALMASAAADTLVTDVGLNAEVTRMLADPVKGNRFIEMFAGNFLTLDAIDALVGDVPEGMDAPAWAMLVQDMAQESTLFLQDAFVNNALLASLTTARHTFINQRLADHYGLTAEYAAAGGSGDFTKVTLPESSPRIGLTTQGFFMSRLSHQPLIFRGKEFRLQFMCGTLPSPPDDPATIEAIERQLMEQDTKSEEELAFERENSPGCAACHALMDPLGRAYSEFDSVGNVVEAETASTFQGTMLDGAVSAANFLAEDKGFAPCLVSHVLGPVSNRLVANATNSDDLCVSSAVAKALGENAGFRDLLLGTLNSLVFKTRIVGQ